MKDIKKLMITLVALLAVTTGAWAEEKMVTINSGTMSSGAVTATGFGNVLGNLLVGQDPATITTSEGVITKLVIKKGTVLGVAFTEANVGVTPGTITYGSDEITVTDINAESVTLSRKGDNNWATSSIDVYYGDAPASSGLEVDWNKTSKTGSFTMTGGNVELEPEYYPQAVLTAAPTAINDVPATTDGAIVNAGTVKNIGETATAQGTVMYYVSPTALDDDALLALAADAWTADVPTAQSFTAAGEVHVYYYVRGNDSDNDDENFSDGDIVSANALTVTIAAAPTYAVTFADDTAEPDKWTASPNANVTKGETVTVTYTGTKKVLGVKAEKKAAAGPKAAKDATAEDLGKLIGADGNIYDDADAATAANTTAVAKIAYVGSDAETSTTYNHGLALALSDVSGTQTWCSQTSSTCLTTQYTSPSAAKADMAGLANTDALVGNTDHTHAAASAARNYNSGIHPTGTSEWFLPSAGQWDKMIGAAGLSNLALQNNYYWSSSEVGAPGAWRFYSVDGNWPPSNKGLGSLVRACLAF